MKIRKIYHPYVMIKHKDMAGGKHCVLQTGGLQLIGAVYVFNLDEKGEQHRREFEANQNNLYHWAKADGYNVYIRLVGSLRAINDVMAADLEEDIHSILFEMVTYYTEFGMTDGMRRHYSLRS
jgi:hypothetical protein